jgi:Transglutaminase-like superfamily
MVAEYVGSNLSYRPTGRNFDEWLFPDETLALKAGDCEDLAFLLAALLEASGISSYCIRVALGSVTRRGHNGNVKQTDHAWVVYQNESGAWEILEPLAVTGKKQHKQKAEPSQSSLRVLDEIEYTPYFVFNRNHLWRIRSSDSAAQLPLADYLGSRKFWVGFNPLFAVKVHEGIYDEALQGIAPGDLRAIKRASLIADVNVLAYDPRDHFDFAYIAEGWSRVQQRLATGDLHDFAYALHAVADFYAHTVYADLGQKDASGGLVPYDPASPNLTASPAYDFSPYQPLAGCSETLAQAAADWNGKLISGQWWRWYTTFPDELKSSPDFAHRRCLPDHDAMAVDSPIAGTAQRRYAGTEYTQQFQLRRAAAVQHIRQIYQAWRRT